MVESIALLSKAVKMEEEGIEFYQDMARKTLNPNVKELFRLFAEEEQQHRDIFLELIDTFSSNHEFKYEGNLGVRNINIFKEIESDFERDRLRENLIFKGDAKTSVADALHMAKSAEMEAIRFYLNIVDDLKSAPGLNSDEILNVIRLIITQEMAHLRFATYQFEYLKANGFWYDSDQLREFRQMSMSEILESVDEIYEEAKEFTDIIGGIEFE